MSFEAAMRASGLRPREIVPDGRWRRCPTDDKPRKRNGAYVLAFGGSRGAWKNYATEIEWNLWRDGSAKVDEESKRLAEAARRRDAQQRQRAVAAMRARFQGLPPLSGTHPYLESKRLSVRGCHGLRLDGEALAIPMMRGGRLMSYQRIWPDGVKLYRKHCPSEGASYDLKGRAPSITCLCEGFATGLAIYQTFDAAHVIVAFSAANLVRIAQDLRVHGMVVVCADNDAQTAKRIGTNPGLVYGQKAAEAIGCGLALAPEEAGTDWADALMNGWSPVRVRMAIMREARFVPMR